VNPSELGSAISLDESTNTVQTENLRLLQIILTEEITTKGLTPDQQNITQYGKELEALYDEILDLHPKSSPKPRCTRTVVFVCPFLARCSLHRAFFMPF
jgi:hypothetical protein